MNTTADNAVTFPVDPEHSGIRLVVFVSFLIIWAATFILLSLLVTSEGINLLALFVGFGAAYGGTALLERLLKRRWPSGRTVTLDRDGVRLMLRGQVQEAMSAEEPVSALLWRFEVNRRSRVPKGWTVLACALEFEGRYLPVYTFMPPNQIETYPEREQFKRLTASREAKGQPGQREDLRLAGEQRRLREAENQRWSYGAEMTRDDFITYIVRLKSDFPQWLPFDSRSS